MLDWQGELIWIIHFPISKLAIAMIPLAKQRNHAINRTVPQKKKVSRKGRLSNASNSADAALELMTGFEPVTYALPRRCATTCATSATLIIIAQPYSFVKLFFKKNLFFRPSKNYLANMTAFCGFRKGESSLRADAIPRVL